MPSSNQSIEQAIVIDSGELKGSKSPKQLALFNADGTPYVGAGSSASIVFDAKKDYGAVGNNVVDDTIALQNCFNAAKAVGGTVFLLLVFTSSPPLLMLLVIIGTSRVGVVEPLLFFVTQVLRLLLLLFMTMQQTILVVVGMISPSMLLQPLLELVR